MTLITLTQKVKDSGKLFSHDLKAYICVVLCKPKTFILHIPKIFSNYAEINSHFDI